MWFESRQQFQERRCRNFINLCVKVPGCEFSAGGEAQPALARAPTPLEPGSVLCRAALQAWGVESLRVASSRLPGLEQWLWGWSGQLDSQAGCARPDRGWWSGWLQVTGTGRLELGCLAREPWRGESRGSFIVV